MEHQDEKPAAKKVKTSDYMSVLLKKNKKSALHVLKSFPAIHADFEASHKSFAEKFASPVEAREFMESDMLKNMAKGGRNASINELMGTVHTRLVDTIKDIRTIERYITLNMPTIEAGGNFGASVQEAVAKALADRRTKLQVVLADLPNYHKERAAAMKECATRGSKKTTTVSVQSKTTGGKADEGGEKKVDTTTMESVDPAPMYLDDHMLHTVALDLKWWYLLLSQHQAAFDTFAFICDVVIKNLEKVKNPRGDGSKGYSYN